MKTGKTDNKIVLKVQDIGHCPSFKNSKMLARGRLFTKPSIQRWMESCINSFVFQLRSSFRTGDGETQTAPLPRSLTVLWKQLEGFDDSVQWIPELHVKVIRVPKGHEGAKITLETL